MTNSESFDELVEWAYSTLPQEIRDLPDFPGIQVLDEPPESVLTRKKWLSGKETLGLYSGVLRTTERHDDVRIAPNLIFVFRGPIQRCSRGDLRAEVKEVVWHEIAHWLGHSEEEVRELGLDTRASAPDDGMLRNPDGRTTTKLDAENENTTHRAPDCCGESGGVQEPPLRCLKCYSADVTSREVDKFVTPPGAWLQEPVRIRTNVCKCGSCGHEWDDDDNM